jgi:hypothetical protein
MVVTDKPYGWRTPCCRARSLVSMTRSGSTWEDGQIEADRRELQGAEAARLPKKVSDAGAMARYRAG